MALTTVTRTSVVEAPAAAVWRRVTTFRGVNAELMPFLRMVPPRRHAGTTLADIEPGEHFGRVWLLYLGVLPLDWDDLTLTEVEDGRFQERSSMASMRRWEHERTVRAVGESRCQVTDVVVFEPRLLLRPLRPVLATVVSALFAHRHRRLRASFA